MRNIFDLCTPRDDVRDGTVKDSEFAADLAQVLNGKAPREYQDPAIFFANTHPTQGLRALLRSVCLRISGRGGEAASIFRLDTQYGGGKTHALIALAHVARQGRSILSIDELVDRDLIPPAEVAVAAFDGENADPVNGRALGEGVRAHTPWGELAYAIGRKAGFDIVARSDAERVAPGADTLRELFGGKPALILLDELSIYLRKVRGRPEADQLAPFLTSLFKAVESSPGVALVFTLAIGKGGLALDAYSAENEEIARRLEEAEKIAARKATLLDPTTEQETAQVIRRRLFARIDLDGASEVLAAYRALWANHVAELPSLRKDEDRAGEFERSFPLHPALMSVLTDKLATLATFQRVRGMLRLMAQGVSRLWQEQPSETYALHVHHLDPSFEPTHNEIVTRLELSAFDPAIRNDVAAASGTKAFAQHLDATDYAGLPPYASYVARTILWHTFAFNEHLKGATPEELRYATLAPGLELAFVNDARQKFVAGSAYLDDRPAAPLRFLTEANLTQIIRRQEDQVDADEARVQVRDRIKSIFTGATMELIPFAGGPYDVDDDVGDGRPRLVLLSADAESVRGDSLRIPALVDKVFRQHGSQGLFRQLQNNLVFLVADDSLRDGMRQRMVRRLALEALRMPERLGQLAEHQQLKVQELYQRSDSEVALAIQQAYRHLFFPSRNARVEGAGVDLGHTAFDVQSASEKPGMGQQQVLRALKDMGKLLRAEDHPLAPTYVRDQTPLKKGKTTTADLRAEFRKDPRLPILIGDENFLALIRKGIEEGHYVYQSGALVCGKGDPGCEIRIDQQSFVYTAVYAQERGIFPRPAPQPEAHGTAKPGSPVAPGGGAYSGASQPGGAVTGEGETEPPTAPSFRHEAPLREALTRIWEDARQAKVARLATLVLRVFDATDAFRLIPATATIPNAKKQIRIDGSYETNDESSLSIEFSGSPEEAKPVREFLDAQLRAARERDLNVVCRFDFAGGLALDGKDPEALTEKLARFATGAAFVEAWAEGAS